jgi:hypothetical protein
MYRTDRAQIATFAVDSQASTDPLASVKEQNCQSNHAEGIRSWRSAMFTIDDQLSPSDYGDYLGKAILWEQGLIYHHPALSPSRAGGRS